jgi:hypothetical protein
MECGKVYYLITYRGRIHGRLIEIMQNRHMAWFMSETQIHKVYMDEVYRCYYDMEITSERNSARFMMLTPDRYLPDYVLESNYH